MAPGTRTGPRKRLMGLTTRMGFGKHRDLTVGEVLDTDPKYLSWCINNVAWFAPDIDTQDALDRESRTVRSPNGVERIIPPPGPSTAAKRAALRPESPNFIGRDEPFTMPGDSE